VLGLVYRYIQVRLVGVVLRRRPLPK